MSCKRTNRHIYGEQAFWVKGGEGSLLKGGDLKVILRLGDRSSRDLAPQQWLPLFEPIPVYTLILGTGDQSKGIDPDFEPDAGVTVWIVRRTVTRLRDVTDADLQYQGGRAVPLLAKDVRTYLENELCPGKELNPDMLMTVYWIERLPDEQPATD